MRFIAFDFETATMQPNSACSLAVARFENGRLIDRHARLFRPPHNRFDDDTIRIHQIRPADVADEPTFDECWTEFLPYFENALAFAHNAEFDLGVLRASLGYYSIPLPRFTCGCTLRLARRVWPDLPSYSLGKLGPYLGHSFRHHRAEEDAVVCGKILLDAMQKTGQTDPLSLLSAYDLTPVDFPGNEPEQGSLF